MWPPRCARSGSNRCCRLAQRPNADLTPCCPRPVPGQQGAGVLDARSSGWKDLAPALASRNRPGVDGPGRPRPRRRHRPRPRAGHEARRVAARKPMIWAMSTDRPWRAGIGGGRSPAAPRTRSTAAAIDEARRDAVDADAMRRPSTAAVRLALATPARRRSVHDPRHPSRGGGRDIDVPPPRPAAIQRRAAACIISQVRRQMSSTRPPRSRSG